MLHQQLDSKIGLKNGVEIIGVENEGLYFFRSKTKSLSFNKTILSHQIDKAHLIERSRKVTLAPEHRSHITISSMYW